MQAGTVPGMQAGMGMQTGTGMQAGASTSQPAASSLPASNGRAKRAGTAPPRWEPRKQLVQVHLPGQAATLSPSCCGLSPRPVAVAWRAGAEHVGGCSIANVKNASRCLAAPRSVCNASQRPAVQTPGSEGARRARGWQRCPRRALRHGEVLALPVAGRSQQAEAMQVKLGGG